MCPSLAWSKGSQRRREGGHTGHHIISATVLQLSACHPHSFLKRLLIYSCYEQRSNSDRGALVEATDRREIDETEKAGEEPIPAIPTGLPWLSYRRAVDTQKVGRTRSFPWVLPVSIALNGSFYWLLTYLMLYLALEVALKINDSSAQRCQ